MNYTDTVKQGFVTLPAALLLHYHHIFKSAEEFLVWQFLYFQNTSSREEIASSEIANSIGQTVSHVNHIITQLTEQGLLDMKTIEINGEIEILFDTSPTFQRLDEVIASGTQVKKSSSENTLKQLISDFEQELGRMLSPFELEDLTKLIKEDAIDPSLIRQALKEAVFNGKTNWKYITAILRNWSRDGVTTLRQVEEKRKERQAAKPSNVKISDDFLNAINNLENDF